MRVKETFSTERTAISLEFFPPKTPKAQDDLMNTIATLRELGPDHVSVTYGAGGSTQDRTYDMLTRILAETDLTVVSHLTSVGATREQVRHTVERFVDGGVQNILALRGDLPPGETEYNPGGGFDFAADLVGFLKKHFPQLGIGVAGFPEGHPATSNRLKEIEYLKAKVDAGADYIVTQLFFDNRDFYDFCERCEVAGIKVPVVAGILPITQGGLMTRLADLAAGARFPAPLQKAIRRTDNDEEVCSVGVHWAAEQVRDLIDHRVKGIHFYTLNQPGPIKRIFEALGTKDVEQLTRS